MRSKTKVAEPLQHSEFAIGKTFWCGGRPWRTTDIGTRVIAAISLDHDDDPWIYNGPPYKVVESVMDEYDMGGCSIEPDPPEETSDGMLEHPRLTEEQIGQVTGFVADYISATREKTLSRGIPLYRKQNASMSGFFRPELLDSVRLIILDGTRIDNPR